MLLAEAILPTLLPALEQRGALRLGAAQYARRC